MLGEANLPKVIWQLCCKSGFEPNGLTPDLMLLNHKALKFEGQ